MLRKKDKGYDWGDQPGEAVLPLNEIWIDDINAPKLFGRHTNWQDAAFAIFDRFGDTISLHAVQYLSMKITSHNIFFEGNYPQISTLQNYRSQYRKMRRRVA